jgi:porphobilinogen synthase
MPVLVREPSGREPADRSSLPTVAPEGIAREARELAGLGVRAVKLFAASRRKDRRATGATDPHGLMPRAIGAFKDAAPGLCVITETCLCPYTDTGHCAIVRADGRADLEATRAVLAEAAVLQAEAGADVVGPAGMVDGGVGAVREALDGAGRPDVGVMPHLIFASSLFGPYRRTMGVRPPSGEEERRPFHVDPSQPRRAVELARRFVAEGADALLLEPALPYVDVLVALRSALSCPIGAFSASGEYLLLLAGAARGGVPDEEAAAVEFLGSLKRAGADLIFTHAAKRLAGRLGRRAAAGGP